jgi:CheY-like chemotaxis protein
MKLNILYVEDEPDIREVAKLALETIGGFTVHLCQSGKHALDYLAHHKPDVILLDVMMPDMDGPTTLRAIAALPSAKSIPVIFMTAKVQNHEIAEYLAMGSIGVISKPFDALELSAQIQALWEKHHG